MAIKSGLVALVDSVRSYFETNGVTATVSLGWTKRTQQINQGPGGANRVVFTPSDDSGKSGRIVGTQQPGPRTFGTQPNQITVRPLVDWERILTVSIWAADTTAPSDEALQIEAVETLFEWTVRAVQAATKNNGRWTEAGWTVSPVEHSFGRELRVGLIFRHPIFDVENDVVKPQGAIAPVLSGTSG